MTSSNINLPEFSEDDFYDFSKDTLFIGKLFKKSNRELKKIKQEKESLFLQLSESHVLNDSLKSENTMLFNTVNALENKLKESEDLLKHFSINNLKSMLCIHTDISNKLDLIVNDLSTSTSHASGSKLDSVDMKPVIVDAACPENSCLNNYVKPNSKDSGTKGKFVPICHHCGKVGHTRPKCFLLKSHRPWKKQEDSRNGIIEKTSSDKCVPPHRRHISQEVRTLLFVKMIILNLQSPSRNISVNKVSLLAFIVVSLDTSSHTVLRSDISSLRSGNQSKRQVSLALSLPSLIMLFRNNDIILKGVLPLAVNVVSMATPRPNEASQAQKESDQ
jgi:hypothetical protein